jgi:hypothetical protein
MPPLCNDPTYLKNATRKWLKIPRLARKCDFNKAFHHKKYCRHYTRIRDFCPHHGNTEDLIGLVAMYCWLQDGYDTDRFTDESSSDDTDLSSNDDENAQNPPPSHDCCVIL